MPGLICHHSPGTVIQLKIPAARVIQIPDNLTVNSYNILNQFFIRSIILHGFHPVKGHRKLRQKLCRRRNGLLCHCLFILKLLYKTEMLHKGMLFRNTNFANQIGIIHHGSLPMKWKPCFRLCMTHAINSPHKIQMPGCPSELSIGNHLIAKRLYFPNQLCNGFILNCL